MPRRIFLGLGLAAAAAFGVFWWLTAPPVILAVTEPLHKPNPANGLTTFNAGGCSSCHAVPGQPDRLRLGGGLAVPSPFGTFYVPNISPDPVDGIGRWTEAEFVNAVTRGISPGGFHYFPAFPYTSYQHAKVGDVRDLFAYLKTWKLLFMDGKPFMPDAARSAQWNRGAYLVNSLGHCAECHSSRNLLGGIIADKRFAGGPNPEGEGWVPNITQKGLEEWSTKDIEYFLETGQLPDGDSAGGAMARVIKNTSQLSPEDRAAMAQYLKSLPPVEGPPRPKKAEKKDGGEKS